MRHEVLALEPSSTAWIEALSRVRHDAYHLPAYLSFAARRQEAGEPRLFLVESPDGCLLVPLIIRRVPADVADGETLFDGVSPRGYPGPIMSAPGDDNGDRFAEAAIRALATHFQERRIVTAFVRMHPLLSSSDDAFRRSGTVVDHGDSVFIDLRKTDDELVGQMRHGHRQDINRARRLGYGARIDDAWECFDDFVEIFQESMDRVGAVPFWRLTRDYFVDLRDSLAGSIHLCVVEKDGALAAAALLTEEDGIVEYHLAGTADAHVRASPSKLVIDFARRWAKERGNRVLHLTGSLQRGDSLSSFKMGFSPLRRPVQSWRFIADAAEYERLGARWSRLRGSPPERPDGFFPSYRKPPDDAHGVSRG